MSMQELAAGSSVRHRLSGQVAQVVRRMPPNTAVGHEDEEVEPVYELDDGSLAAHGLLEVLKEASSEEVANVEGQA